MPMLIMALAAFTVIGFLHYASDNNIPSIQVKESAPRFERGATAPAVQMGENGTALADKAARFVEFARACISYGESGGFPAPQTGGFINYGQLLQNNSSLPLPPSFSFGQSWGCWQNITDGNTYYAIYGTFPPATVFPINQNTEGSWTMGIVDSAARHLVSPTNGDVIPIPPGIWASPGTVMILSGVLQ